MGLILKQYAGSSVSPKDDAVLYDMVIGKSGVVAGCTITHLGSNQLLITGGYGIIKGRVFVVEEETIYTTLSESGTVNGRLKLRMDIGNTEEPIKFVTEAATTLPELEKDEDCNYNSGIYEIALATYSISESFITNLKTVYETLGTSLAVLKGDVEKLNSNLSGMKKAFITDRLPHYKPNDWISVANITSLGINLNSKVFIKFNIHRTSDLICDLIPGEINGVRVVSGYIQMLLLTDDYYNDLIDFDITYL